MFVISSPNSAVCVQILSNDLLNGGFFFSAEVRDQWKIWLNSL